MHTKGDLHEEKKDDLVHSVDCDNGLLLFSRIYDRSMGMITWKYECDGDSITFQFDMEDESVEDMFYRWVDFMNAIGYSVNKTEMYEMWNGE